MEKDLEDVDFMDVIDGCKVKKTGVKKTKLGAGAKKTSLNQARPGGMDEAGPGGMADAGPGGMDEAGPGGMADARPGGMDEAGPGGMDDARPGGMDDARPGGMDEAGPGGMDEARRAKAQKAVVTPAVEEFAKYASKIYFDIQEKIGESDDGSMRLVLHMGRPQIEGFLQAMMSIREDWAAQDLLDYFTSTGKVLLPNIC
jgi:hypothetical protein